MRRLEDDINGRGEGGGGPEGWPGGAGQELVRGRTEGETRD